ncbi:MAG: tyrosine--tRNA ligase [Candidatus Shapirobacteria bacterium]|nr:tyrosine--tRNA ligase [Candidatus Shapirobacteria bacterium]MDD4382925.1 tyrosine--tRNA ligase [Candidatus Shapirobacteria bacterium]
MEINEKIRLITRNCQEVLTEDDLKKLIENETELNHYIGFEISGMVHLGTGLISMGKIADFLKAGVKCNILMADFHSYLNNKLGGNWENIRWATEHYFKEGLIASLKCFGVEENQVNFVTGKDLYEKNFVHWETFMEVGKHVTLSRDLRSISIMGKKEGNDVDMATLFYPPLQVADIFTMQVNLAHAGMDQRKAHVIARDVAKKLTINPLKNNKGEIIAPVAIHQNLIAGLTGPAPQERGSASLQTYDEESLKMSKSKPGSAIFIHDTPEEIRNKIKKAYGPPKEIEFNPLINWVQTLVFWGEKTGNFKISRPEKFGGDIVYTKVDELIEDYKNEKLYPLDLKNGLADWLIEKLEPARKHFEKAEVKEGLEKMKEFLAKK